MRLVEYEKGSIKIDGADIKTLGLHDLREQIAVIPQDPVMFQGTIRTNLDPTNQYTDEQIQNAIDVSHLGTALTDEQKKLDAEVLENGSNYSVGQRQLMCLARALLRNCKILLLDEATSQIDTFTDDKLQETLRSEFKDNTMLTIAHRLSTIMDYDRVLVMERGEVAEFGTPETLLSQNGIFAEMVRKDKEERNTKNDPGKTEVVSSVKIAAETVKKTTDI